MQQNTAQAQAQQQIPATLEIPVTLQAQEWQLLIQLLQEGPYRVVRPLIEKISGQAQSGAFVQMALEQKPDRPNAAGQEAP